MTDSAPGFDATNVGRGDVDTAKPGAERADSERLREQLRRAAEDGERLYRVRMHEGAGPTIMEDNRIDGILTRELETALGFVDALLDALTIAEQNGDQWHSAANEEQERADALAAENQRYREALSDLAEWDAERAAKYGYVGLREFARDALAAAASPPKEDAGGDAA